MKNRVCCWILLVIGAGFLLMTIGSFIVVSTFMSTGSSKIAIKNGSFLVIDLAGLITEYQTAPRFAVWMRQPPILADILSALESAADDPRIAGVVLRPSGAAGFAELRELREAVGRFKESKKPVYAYLEVATDRDYYLASAADTIVIAPTSSGGMVMLGLSISSTYVARTFDKLGIKFHVLHAGRFKGAYENLGQDSMSVPLRESLTSLLDDMFQTYVGEAAQSRKTISRNFLEEEILHPQELFITDSMAIASKLADLSMDWEDLRDRFRIGDEFRSVSVSRYRKSRLPKHGQNEIAVVFAQGEITYGDEGNTPARVGEGIRSDEFIKMLREIREDEDIKAVVLRVNSPGGSALASELILNEIKRTKTKKPVVVSMGNVAASGGYYISCAASRIIAQPNTITGSIGVVSVMPSAEGLFDKIGARVETVEKGKWGQFFRLDKDFTQEQEAILMGLMNHIYQGFLHNVADGRGLSIDSVESSAEGRVWTGSQALKLGLADELGGLDLAISRAAELAGINQETAVIRSYPHEKDIFSYVLRWLDAKVEDALASFAYPTSEIELRKAANYIERFMNQRDFVQMMMPLEVPQ